MCTVHVVIQVTFLGSLLDWNACTPNGPWYDSLQKNVPCVFKSPNYKKYSFCKHGVALALASNSDVISSIQLGGCRWPGTMSQDQRLESNGVAKFHLSGSEKKVAPPNINTAQ